MPVIKNKRNAQLTKTMCRSRKRLWGVKPTPIKHIDPITPAKDPTFAKILINVSPLNSLVK